MASQYGLEVAEVFSLRWRRFIVLLSPEFSLKAPKPGGSSDYDWEAALDKATGRSSGGSAHVISIDDYMKRGSRG